MNTTPALASLIKTVEGFRPEAYFDGEGIPTIGYGTTVYSDGTPVQIGDSIDHEQAEREVFHYIRNTVEPTLERHFSDVKLEPNQRDALGSFIYNLGPDKDGKYPTLHRLIVDGSSAEEIARQFVKYRNKDSSSERGLYRRRVAEALMFQGLPYERGLGIALEDDVLDIIAEVRGNAVSDELFDPPVTAIEPDELPETDLIEPFEDMPTYWDKLTEAEQTEFLNRQQSANITGEAQPPVRVAVEPRANAIAIEAVPYLDNPEPKVKPIEASQRGRGYAKTQTGRDVGVVAVGGTAATAIGAMEPAVKFVDKYPKETIAYVFFAMLVFGVLYYYYGLWQRQKGEDEAEDLLS